MLRFVLTMFFDASCCGRSVASADSASHDHNIAEKCPGTACRLTRACASWLRENNRKFYLLSIDEMNEAQLTLFFFRGAFVALVV